MLLRPYRPPVPILSQKIARPCTPVTGLSAVIGGCFTVLEDHLYAGVPGLTHHVAYLRARLEGSVNKKVPPKVREEPLHARLLAPSPEELVRPAPRQGAVPAQP
jgi:hypothetical protein